MPMALSLMADNIKNAPAGSPEETVQYIMQKMQKLSAPAKTSPDTYALPGCLLSLRVCSA